MPLDYSALVARRHPFYNELKERADFYESTYKGGPKWFEHNIFKYTKEGPKSYQARIKRAYRFNHTKEVVDAVTKYIFKTNVVRSDDAPEFIQDFWKNTTIYGRNIDGLAKSIDRNTSIFGRIYVVVDSKANGAIVNVEDEKNQDFKTYAYIVKPQHVLDLSYDEFGELNWILIYEPFRNDSDPFNSDGKTIKRFRLWTRKEWHLIEFSGDATTGNGVLGAAKITSGIHNLGVVPVIPVDGTQSDDIYSSTPLISDIAYLDRAVANYLSNLDVIIQDQTFSQLIVPSQALPEGEDGYNKIVEMGTKSVFTFDGTAGMKPEYISPDPKQAQVLLDVINKIIGEIYNSIGMAGERTKQDNSVGIDNSSGVAKAYDFEKINTLLACKARNLEDAENKIVHLVAKWYGKENELMDKKYVLYSEDFDVKGLYDEFEIASQLTLLDAPFDVRREQMKVVINKLFPQLKEDLIKKMESSLKNWPQDVVEITETMSRSEGNNVRNLMTKSAKDKNESSAEKVEKTATGSRQGQVTDKTDKNS